ncbi:MAG TPA: DUF1028 domain-containing protein [bacterium]|nr:DUF1028 domain-containing protein [bacterium]
MTPIDRPRGDSTPFGPLFHTFSIIARCPRTGRLGVGIATHAIAVASRCPHVKARVGAVATQAHTDPRLGQTALRLLEQGFSAQKVVHELVESDPHIQHRQLGVVDADGVSAAFTGSENGAWAGHLTGPGVVAMGNALVGERVVQGMLDAFERSATDDLEERLLRAVEAGRDAGGQPNGQRSSGLLVYADDPYPWVDLRVDEHAEPIGELRRVYELYKPLREYFRVRAAHPDIGSEDEWRAR